MKIIKKPSGSKVKLLQTEVDILKKVKHPSCVECYDVFDSDDKLYLVMELCEGSELFDRIVDKGHFTEADAQLRASSSSTRSTTCTRSGSPTATSSPRTC